MIRQNLHTHTRFCDGKNTPMEMGAAALAAGLTSLGFSGHSVLPYDNDWCMTGRNVPDYIAAVLETRDAFRGRLDIFLGLEWDGCSPQSPDGFDYIIGSLHHIAMEGEYPSIDDTAPITRDILNRYFHNDEDAMAEAYFAQYAALAANPAVDIVGHFDLLTKFSETDGICPGTTPRYRDAAMSAMEVLLKADKIFEVNTGAMAGGKRSVPYPAPWLLKELKARRARILVSSDAHSAETVAYAFPETEKLLRSVGFRERWEFWLARGFTPVRL